MQKNSIESIEARLEKLTILELRETARAVGVAHPAVWKREEVKAKIIAIVNGSDAPVPCTQHTAVNFADKELVRDIQSYRESIIGI